MIKTASDILKNMAAIHGDTPVVGGVAIHDLIASGGMGAVFKGVHLRLRIPVAIKFLFDGDDGSANRFAEEASVAAKINNPNVVRVYDVNKEKQLHYIIQELVEGHTAEHHLIQSIHKQVPLTEDFVLNLGADVARGLIAIHKINYLHLDIKPTNIMVSSRDGVSKILDMGLAQRVGETSTAQGVTTTRTTLATGGTPGYASPEQLQCLEVGPSSDIYSLGVTLYELLAGRRAHDAGSWGTAIVQQTTNELPDIRRLRPDVCKDTAELIDRCVCIDPELRFQNPMDVLSKIAQMNHTQISRRKPGTMILPPNPTQSIRIARPLVYCIDDDVGIGEILQEMLIDAGYAAEFFTDGKQALEYMKVTMPDIVLLDYEMPGMTGLEVCRAIRSNAALKHLPVVLLTGSAEPEKMTLAMHEGATDYIFKPVQSEELFARLTCLTRITRTQRELEALESQYGNFRKHLSAILGKEHL